MSSPKKHGGDDAPPKLDLDTPRMKAAMKVTGIEARDLEEPPPVDSNDINNEAAHRRLDLMDRKRRQLMRQLEETASHLDDTLVEYFLSPGTAAATQTSDEQHEFLMTEKGKIDKKRERVKDEIMKELKLEMERKQANEARKKAREDMVKAMHQKHAETAEERKKKANDKAAHHQKIEERGRAIDKAEWERRREINKKSRSEDERVSKQNQELKQMWADKREERSKKIADIAQKNVENQRLQEEESLRRWEEDLAKEMEREERLRTAFEEKLQQKRDQYSDRMGKAIEQLQKNEEKRRETYNENVKKLGEARQRGVEQLNGVQEKAKAHREKELTKWTSQRTERRNSFKAKMNKWKADINDSQAKSVEVREKHFEDNVYKKAELRGYLLDLVHQNKNRLERADACTREQTLAKIRSTNDKIEQHNEKMRQVMVYRANAMKEEMIGKTHLTQVKSVMRDCPTKRINQLLAELDMPLLPTESPKEGEENTNNQ